MKILTLNNRSFDLNELPDEVDEDTRFSVLDNSITSFCAMCSNSLYTK